MKKIIIYLVIFLLVSFLLQTYAQAQTDEKLLQDAKILLLDKEWKKAQGKFEELLEEYPDSPWFSQALFYKAKCLQEQKGKEREALDVYKSYIKREDRNRSLIEESERSIIDLAHELYKSGKKSYLKEIENRLSSSNKVIRYYAAFKLSYIKDKRVASRGIPVLKEILKKVRDDELRDRAKIALLRIDPDSLREFEEERYERRPRVLKIRVRKTDRSEPEVKIDIPWALADLALGAISEKDKAAMRAEGYDLDRIRRELMEFKGNIIEIKTKDTIYKIWID